MVKYYESVILFFIFLLPVYSNNEFQVQDNKTGANVNFHRRRLCNQTTSCSEVNLKPPAYRDLRYQNCMCDEECPQFGDCCKDSGLSNLKTNFTCVAIANNHNVYMRTFCSSTWLESSTIKDYCENTENFNKTDIPLFIPVTSQSNLTYRNLFCALCNDETIFDFWKVGIWAARNSSLTDLSVDRLRSDLTDYINEISIKAVIPPDLARNVRYCVPNVIKTCPPFWNGSKICPEYTSYVYSGNKIFMNMECLLCNQNKSAIPNDKCFKSKIQSGSLEIPKFDDFLVKFPGVEKFCNEISDQNSAYQELCNQNDNDNTAANECASPEMCHIDMIFNFENSNEVVLVDDDTIFLKTLEIELKNRPETVGPNEWLLFNQDNESKIFVCGLNVDIHSPKGYLNVISKWLSEILTMLSIVCLILHLIVFQQLPQLRNTPGKSLAVYSFSLLVAFLCLELDEKMGLCKITAVLLHYTLLSCFTWMLLMSYNCWLSTYLATTKLRQSSDKNSRKFICYCSIAFLVPLLIVGIGLFFEHSSARNVPCSWKPKYGKKGYCFISQSTAFLALFIIPSSILFVVNNFFFSYTAYLIYFNRRKTSVNVQERINFKLYIRLALIMGSTWSFGTLYTFTEWSITQLMFIIFNMSQGIFIFVAFTLQERTLKMLRTKFQGRDRIVKIFNWCLGEKIKPNDTVTLSLKSNPTRASD